MWNSGGGEGGQMGRDGGNAAFKELCLVAVFNEEGILGRNPIEKQAGRHGLSILHGQETSQSAGRA